MQGGDQQGIVLTTDRGVERLITKLCAHEQWRHLPLGTLLPGLESAQPPLQEGWLSTRAVNGLGRAGVNSWPDLATVSPSSLSGIPNIGPKSVREILNAAVDGWTVPTTGTPSSLSGRRAGPRGSRRPAGLAGAFEELESDAPDFEIFRRHRLVAEGGPTLQELGDELSVSRERIRQRESHMREAIARRMGYEDWPIRIAVDQLTEQLGALGCSEQLPGVFASIAGSEDGCPLSPPHRRALLLHLGGYVVSGRWVQCNDLDARTDALLWALTEGHPVALEDVVRELDSLGVRAGLGAAWIESRGDFRVLGSLVGRKCESLENALAILEEVGHPLEVAELVERTATGVSPTTFRQRIHHDGRFLRRGVRHYGLKEWGGQEYTTIAEEMEKAIERGGGGVDLGDLTASLVERFGVAGGSVRQQARTSQFGIDSAGRVSRRVGGFVVPRAPLALTHHCFHLEQGWALKLIVTGHMLHGANSRMPLSFARALGLQVANSSTYASRFGNLGAYWPRYAASSGRLGSLRIPARELQADEGDRLFVVLVGRNAVDFRLIEGSRCEAASGIGRLALECGLEPGNEPLTQVLAALGFDPHLSNAEAAICARLTERQEGELTGSLSTAAS